MTDFFNDKDDNLAPQSTHIMPIFAEINPLNEDELLKQEVLDDIPVLPLRNSVLFPGMTLPVAVGRKKSLALIEDAQKNHMPIAVFCQKSSKVDNPSEKDIYSDGTIAEIVKILELPDESIK